MIMLLSTIVLSVAAYLLFWKKEEVNVVLFTFLNALSLFELSVPDIYGFPDFSIGIAIASAICYIANGNKYSVFMAGVGFHQFTNSPEELNFVMLKGSIILMFLASSLAAYYAALKLWKSFKKVK